MFACAGRAAGVAMSAFAVVQVVPLVLATTTFPWAFAGLGPRELATASLFAWIGLSAADGVAVSITFGALSLLASAPGVMVLLFPGRQRA
jgi:glycosyltransferase 2 family protein